ncbi:glycogen/starch/alpha-glucan phosphorylase [Alkaliphilus metalliredigens QYMF]|uniref:Alpha-1,4 glucan phosphorylase n=1 Tax=Alkaliphilus metalliredigens (strain QYMF) TaxID=293826 RepID=A6TNT7_ALKMQ|nr:glycogen/starch/alpha-glucan phosphorylase [Alkaliphilus metalliredigens]ABR47855.1 glycogen/starch/alpha-glucan phosphorylase [Alkaliphilus metalliredigens QYMF]
MLNKRKFKESVERNIRVNFLKTIKTASGQERYHAVVKTLMEEVVTHWQETNERHHNKKKACYFSAEFLMGRAFGNNLLNLGIYEEVKEVLNELEIDIDEVEKAEADAGLGNGGLGRLAACFLESCATMNLPVTGYGIRYHDGIFKQRFVDGFQVEEGDPWLAHGEPWSFRRSEDAVTVVFGDESVKAVPYDTPIIGYGNQTINTLRLWQGEPLINFDFNLFNEQRYDESVKEKNRAEDISRVLYPNDSKEEGKILRLKQQYFFVSASLQDLVKKYKETNGNEFEKFHQYHAIQLNDTHPVVAIPELMRILTDEEGLCWEKAWGITTKTFSYTNHTILTEALEKWDVKLYQKMLPRVYEIVKGIDEQFIEFLNEKSYEKKKIDQMKIISNGRINKAWLAIYGSHTINGVAEIHTNILKHKELKDWYELYPQKFQNKTNGITPRRWLALCNQELSALITALLNTEDWITDLSQLKKLEKHQYDDEVLKRFMAIKRTKKKQLAAYIFKKEGIQIDPNSIYNIQIKRLHEYKRQLLNAFHILDLYYELKENPDIQRTLRTFIFGAKAAPGYVRAKGIIKYINEVAKLVNNDPQMKDQMKVAFVENYNVSYGEKLFPAADLSEQISTVGKEASGTGNMKFMLNGSPTIGTNDGANIEIVQEAGEENNFIFGMKIEELQAMEDTYEPRAYYESVPGLKRVVDTLIDGTFDDGDTGMFQELYDSLLEGASWHKPDNYYLLKDFDDYREAQRKAEIAYADEIAWARKCWMNIANAGKFSSDRTITEYAKQIWHI